MVRGHEAPGDMALLVARGPGGPDPVAWASFSVARCEPDPRRSTIQATRWTAGTGVGIRRARGEIRLLPSPP
eukprot:8831287-Pyramimonas_sp.AAC.1